MSVSNPSSSQSYEAVVSILRSYGPLPAVRYTHKPREAAARNQPLTAYAGRIEEYGMDVLFVGLVRRFEVSPHLSVPELEREARRRVPGAVVLFGGDSISYLSPERECRIWLNRILKSGALPPGVREQVEAEMVLRELL